MTNNDFYITPLLEAIIDHKLPEKWAGSLFATPETQDEIINEKKEKAILEYKRMMLSPKNDKSDGYRSWAISTALGIKLSGRGRHKTKSL